MREHTAACSDCRQQKWLDFADPQSPKMMMEQDAADDREWQVRTLDPGTIVRSPAQKTRAPGKGGVGVQEQFRFSNRGAEIEGVRGGRGHAAKEQIRVPRVAPVEPGDLNRRRQLASERCCKSLRRESTAANDDALDARHAFMPPATSGCVSDAAPIWRM